MAGKLPGVLLALCAVVPGGQLAGSQRKQATSARPLQTAPARKLSHVERFEDAKTRYRRAARHASARLLKDPNDARALGERGVAWIHLGEIQPGLADLKRAASLEPRSAEAQAHLAYGLWVAGSLQQALAAARQAVALNRNLASGEYYAGRLALLTGGDLKQAVNYLKRAALLSPENTGIRLDLLQADRKAGDAVGERVELRLLQHFLPPTSAVLLYAQGLVVSDAGELAEATTDFRKALDAEPGLAGVRQDLGIALAQQGKWQESAQVLEPLARAEGGSFRAAYFYALALQNSGRHHEAEDEVRHAIEINPRSADGYTLLGIVLATEGANRRSAEALARAATLDPASFDAQFYVGRARYQLQDFTGARAAFAQAVRLRPKDAQARFFLATVLEQTGDRDQALAQYRELTALSPDDPHGWIGLGNFLAEHGDDQQGEAALEQALLLDATSFEANFALGRLFVHEQKWALAIARLRRAVARAPDSAEAHYQLGLALTRVGQAEEAKKEFATVDRLNRNYRTAAQGMAPAGVKQR